MAAVGRVFVVVSSTASGVFKTTPRCDFYDYAVILTIRSTNDSFIRTRISSSSKNVN